jgi:hypothetical protein
MTPILIRNGRRELATNLTNLANGHNQRQILRPFVQFVANSLLNLELDLRPELHAEVVLCAVIKVDKVSDIDAQADWSNIKLAADTGIYGAVGCGIAKAADGTGEAVANGAVGPAKPYKAALYSSEKPGVIRSQYELGTEQAVQQGQG